MNCPKAHHFYRKTNAICMACLCIVVSLLPCDARKGMQHGAELGMPDNPDAVAGTVQNFAKLGQFPQAIKMMDDAIARTDGKPQYYYLRGQLYELTERLDEAEADYRKAFLSGKLNTRECLRMAWSLNHFGGIELSRQICDKAVSDKVPTQASRAYFIRARLNSSSKNFPAAISDYEHSLKLVPEQSQANFELGRLYYSVGRYQDAVNCFNLVLAEAKPKEQVKIVEAHRWRGEGYSKLNRNQDAIDDFSQAVKMSPLQVVLLVRRAEVYKKMGLTKEADADMKKAHAVEDTMPF